MMDSLINTIVQGDCLEVMKRLPDKSVDAVVSDPPYNTTNLAWEQSIDWVTFWSEARRVLNRKNAPVILFSQQPFTTDLIMSNRKGFRYELIWHKTMPVGFLDANRKPLRTHENMLIFGDSLPDYYPQMDKGKPYTRPISNSPAYHYGKYQELGTVDDKGERYPISIWVFAQERDETHHPTAKPLPLLEKLVLTYTRPGDIVLDPFVGSGTTALACQNLGRSFYACDSDAGYVEAARLRLATANPYEPTPLPDGRKQLSLFTGLKD